MKQRRSSIAAVGVGVLAMLAAALPASGHGASDGDIDWEVVEELSARPVIEPGSDIRVTWAWVPYDEIDWGSMPPEDIPAPEDFEQVTEAEYDAINVKTAARFGTAPDGAAINPMGIVSPMAVRESACNSWRPVKLAYRMTGEGGKVRTQCYTGSGRATVHGRIEQGGGNSVVYTGNNRARIYYHEGGAVPQRRWSGWKGPGTSSTNNPNWTVRGRVEIIEMNPASQCGPTINCPVSEHPAM